MMMSSNDTDMFGYELDPDQHTEFVTAISGQGYYACERIEDKWHFTAVPMFMLVKRTDRARDRTRFGILGVYEHLGELERFDTSDQFMGWAHESEFELPGERLKPEAVDRMQNGEFMCGDPARFFPCE